MYKQLWNDIENKVKTTIVFRSVDNTFIPCDLNNTDYIRFKKEIAEDKAELQDADGNTMTAAEAKAFVATLP